MSDKTNDVKQELLKKFRAHFGREPDVVAYALGHVASARCFSAMSCWGGKK